MSSPPQVIRTLCNFWYCNMMAEQCLNFCVKGTRYITRNVVVCRCLKTYPDVYNKVLWSCSNPFFFNGSPCPENTVYTSPGSLVQRWNNFFFWPMCLHFHDFILTYFLSLSLSLSAVKAIAIEVVQIDFSWKALHTICVVNFFQAGWPVWASSVTSPTITKCKWTFSSE